MKAFCGLFTFDYLLCTIKPLSKFHHDEQTNKRFSYCTIKPSFNTATIYYQPYEHLFLFLDKND